MAPIEVLDRYAWARDCEPVSVHSAGPRGFFRYSQSTLSCAGVGLGLAVVGYLKEFAVAVFVTVGLVSCAALVIWAIIGYRKVLVRYALVYAEGVVWLERGRWDGAPWGEILECFRGEELRGGWAATREVAIKTVHGASPTFTHALSDWEGLADTLLSRAVALRGPELLARFRAGETVAFGPVQVGPKGLTINGTETAWEDMVKLYIHNGHLVTLGRGQASASLIFLGEVPNHPVLLQLLQEAPGPKLVLM